jgi:predicted membrane protein (TIGR00267 family)
MEYSEKEYQEHLAKEHKMTTFSTYLREIVYGGNDGIVTTFAVVAGFTGASGGEHIVGVGVMAVLLFGLANLFADGVSMGLGNFLSIRSQKDIYRSHKKKELKEIRENPKMERAETLHILKERGYTEEQAKEMTDLYQKNEKYWLEFMMKQELDMPDPESDNPFLTGLATFLSFVFFGFIPLVPYFLLRMTDNTFIVSVSFTFFALLLLGLLRWKVSKESVLRSVGEVVLVGGTSAVVAFVVGTFFRG